MKPVNSLWTVLVVLLVISSMVVVGF